MLPSELPRSLPCAAALASVAPRLLRTLSSKPGSEARCFLKGDPTEPSVPRSGTACLEPVDASPGLSVPALGVPEIGEPEAPRSSGRDVLAIGSAEC